MVTGNPIRILVVESEPAVAGRVPAILLSRAGHRLFRVQVVGTVRDAIQNAATAPEIILVDVDPAEAPSFSTLIRLKPAFSETPIIALLPDGWESLALQVVQAGAAAALLAAQITDETLPSFLLRTIERHGAQKAIRESEERFRLMIENASDVVTTLEPTGTITYAGPSTERILDYRPDDMVGRNALDYIHRDDRRRFLDHFEKAFETSDQLPIIQFRFFHRDGRWVHMEAKGRIVQDSNGRRYCILNTHDVTHRVKLESQLRSLSLRDELTGLHNRRSFVTFFEQQCKMAHRSQKKVVCLLFIDLDKFKAINDTHGHKEGDRALIAAAKILNATFRQADIVARLGGDEFVVLLTDTSEETRVERLRQRLFDALDEWNARENRPYKILMSVGVVRHDLGRASSVEEVLLQADALMYEHKRRKKAGEEAVGT